MIKILNKIGCQISLHDIFTILLFHDIIMRGQ